MHDPVINLLLQSSEPSIRYKVQANVLGCGKESPEGRDLQQEVRTSPRVHTLLSERDREGHIPWHPYFKWRGAHWVLACLSDIGYPAGDRDLIPMLDQVYDWLLGKQHVKSIRTIDGRVRRCASQEGYALYYSLMLGLSDERTYQLAQRLIKWQWPDGGWNCDKKPEAINSSFMESLIPLRALVLYARKSGDPAADCAVEKAAEVFLKRSLFLRQWEKTIISPDFVALHYPCYWHYDILFALKVMTEMGCIDDPRCKPALDLLEAKRLPDGGFSAETKYYRVSEKMTSGCSLVSWGVTGPNRMNEFVTADALYVLRAAGRLALTALGRN